jgi:Protein of unknown function (DUF4232)
MRRLVKAMAAAVLVSLTAGGCSSTVGNAHAARPMRADQRPSSPAGSATPSAPAGEPRCSARALALQPGTYVAPMTGEHAVMYALTNRGSVSCTLTGYPQVTLYDTKGAVLPFRYAKGGGAYVTATKPVTVVLAPRASAYVLVAKYRCDLGVARNATAIRLTLAAAHGTSFAGHEAVAISGSTGLSYCRGGRHDPGQAIAVSPVEPTQQATGSLP